MFQNFPLFCFCLCASFAQSICWNTNGEPRVKGLFVFGSSVVDNGNNNFLTRARADYLPYGVDFPLGPTGRFTNGKNFIDVLGEKLMLTNYIPTFNDPSTRGSNILHGVNYASGGSGILDTTGAVAINVTSLNQQIRNFETVTLPDLEQQFSDKKSRDKILSEFLFVVGSGGNDYSFNYFLGLSGNITVEAFTANLTSTLSNQLKRLYDLGALKFVLMAINPNGCTPMATARAPPSTGCVESLNRAAELFNEQVKDLVDDIRPRMPGSNLVFVNAYEIITNILRFFRIRGFRNTNSSCCEVTPISQGGTGVLCRRGGSVCPNRDEYVYFDGLHTTEAVNVIVATKAFLSILRNEVYPYNVRRLSEI